MAAVLNHMKSRSPSQSSELKDANDTNNNSHTEMDSNDNEDDSDSSQHEGSHVNENAGTEAGE